MTVLDEQIWRAGTSTVTCVHVVPEHLVPTLWDIYITAFDQLRPMAAARQVLWREEFEQEMADPRVWKYLAFGADELPVGMATLTADLQTIPWISPQFYAERYPVEHARNALFYVPFVCTDPRRARAGAMWLLVQAFIERVAAAEGVVGYDVCAYNNEVVHFADRMDAWNRRLGAHDVMNLDSQNYYVAEYGQGVQ